MTMAFREASLETAASPATVWRVWSDVNHWPEWNPDMNESRLDGPLKLGATGMINTKSGGKHDVVVTQYEEVGRSRSRATLLRARRWRSAPPTPPNEMERGLRRAFDPR